MIVHQITQEGIITDAKDQVTCMSCLSNMLLRMGENGQCPLSYWIASGKPHVSFHSFLSF